MKELLDLGETPDEIATNLIRLECNGVIGKPDSCPLAQYIKKKITNTSFISVGKGRIIIHISCGNSAESQYTYYHRVEIGLNEAFKDFINNFDSGLYPKLIRNL